MLIVYGGGEEEKFMLLTRKGVYPHSYMNSMERYLEPELPSIEHFRDTLNDENCSIKDYAHAQSMWREFGMQTLSDLCRVYCITDTLLLSANIMKYRENVYSNFGLEALHYFTAPGKYTVGVYVIYDNDTVT